MGRDPKLASTGLWGSCWSPWGPWGSRGVPREGSATPRATETGEELSHRLGFGAALHSRQSVYQGKMGLEQVGDDTTAWTHSAGSSLPLLGQVSCLHQLDRHPGELLSRGQRA